MMPGCPSRVMWLCGPSLHHGVGFLSESPQSDQISSFGRTLTQWNDANAAVNKTETHNSTGLELCYDIGGDRQRLGRAASRGEKGLSRRTGVIKIPGPNYKNGRR